MATVSARLAPGAHPQSPLGLATAGAAEAAPASRDAGPVRVAATGFGPEVWHALQADPDGDATVLLGEEVELSDCAPPSPAAPAGASLGATLARCFAYLAPRAPPRPAAKPTPKPLGLPRNDSGYIASHPGTSCKDAAPAATSARVIRLHIDATAPPAPAAALRSPARQAGALGSDDLLAAFEGLLRGAPEREMLVGLKRGQLRVVASAASSADCTPLTRFHKDTVFSAARPCPSPDASPPGRRAPAAAPGGAAASAGSACTADSKDPRRKKKGGGLRRLVASGGAALRRVLARRPRA
jgi:hypothetical protein